MFHSHNNQMCNCIKNVFSVVGVCVQYLVPHSHVVNLQPVPSLGPVILRVKLG